MRLCWIRTLSALCYHISSAPWTQCLQTLATTKVFITNGHSHVYRHNQVSIYLPCQITAIHWQIPQWVTHTEWLPGGMDLRLTTWGGCCNCPGALLDEEHPPLDQDPGDMNAYTLGRIGRHNIVIGCLPLGTIGESPATAVAKDMLRSFPNIKIGFMAGIGGGAPGPVSKNPEDDIRLGDIVVSKPGPGHGRSTPTQALRPDAKRCRWSYPVWLREDPLRRRVCGHWLFESPSQCSLDGTYKAYIAKWTRRLVATTAGSWHGKEIPKKMPGMEIPRSREWSTIRGKLSTSWHWSFLQGYPLCWIRRPSGLSQTQALHRPCGSLRANCFRESGHARCCDPWKASQEARCVMFRDGGRWIEQ